MRTFKMVKTHVNGQYATEKAVIPNSGDIIKLLYPDRDSITARFEPARRYMTCTECPLGDYRGGLLTTCSALRVTKSGNYYRICEVKSGTMSLRWCRISKVSDIMEEL
jgi:hypothetical protein